MSSSGIGPLQKVALLEIWRSHLLNGDAGLPSTVCNAYKHELLTKFLKDALKFSETFYISTENKDLKNKKMWFGEIPVQETVRRGNARRGNVGELFVQRTVPRWTVRRGTVHRGKVSRKNVRRRTVLEPIFLIKR